VIFYDKALSLKNLPVKSFLKVWRIPTKFRQLYRQKLVIAGLADFSTMLPLILTTFSQTKFIFDAVILLPS
jgi:hypothetical protein